MVEPCKRPIKTPMVGGSYSEFLLNCRTTKAIVQRHGFKGLELLGVILFIVSLSLETLADIELQQFKKMHAGKVCNQKLWSLSRHPNCFFEWLVWCSFSLFALSASYGVLSIISPLALFVIMVFITIPLTERESVKPRGQA